MLLMDSSDLLAQTASIMGTRRKQSLHKDNIDQQGKCSKSRVIWAWSRKSCHSSKARPVNEEESEWKRERSPEDNHGKWRQTEQPSPSRLCVKYLAISPKFEMLWCGPHMLPLSDYTEILKPSFWTARPTFLRCSAVVLEMQLTKVNAFPL